MEFKKLLKKEGLKEFVIRLIVLAVAFVGFSVVLGPLLVNTVLMSKLGFYMYGGLGYIVLLMCIAFVLLSRDKLTSLKKYPVSIWNFILFGVSIGLGAAFYFVGMSLHKNYEAIASNAIPYMIGAHVLFLSIFIILGLAVFGLQFVKDFWKGYRKEILICLGLSVVFYSLMGLVWKSWEFFSNIVTQVVYFLLKLSFADIELIVPRTIRVEGFVASIAEACSGVYSIFLFTCLYVFMVLVDWKVMNKVKAVLMIIPAFIGLVLTNCLRIYLLFLVGVLYDPHFAVNMFHSYIGTVLFLIYFMAFMAIFYKWMKR